MSEQMPSVGRTVHFFTNLPAEQSNGQRSGPYAAIVAQVLGSGALVNLKVMPPFAPPYDAGSVPHKGDTSAFGSAERYWDWPPRV